MFQHPESTRVMSFQKLRSTCNFLQTHLHKPNFNGLQATCHFLPWRSTPRLLRCLHTTSLAKTTPKGLKDRKCKKITLHKHPPMPCSGERLCSGDSVCPQGWESQDTDQQMCGTWSSHLALWDTQSFSPSCGICFRCNQEKGSLQSPRWSPQSLGGAMWTGGAGKVYSSQAWWNH